MSRTITVIVCAYNEAALLAGLSLFSSGPDPSARRHPGHQQCEHRRDAAPWRARFPACAWWTSPRKGWWWRVRPLAALAQTDIVAYVDADCRAPITWLERVEARFSQTGRARRCDRSVPVLRLGLAPAGR